MIQTTNKVPMVETKARIPHELYQRLEALKNSGVIKSINEAFVEGAKLLLKKADKNSNGSK